MTPGPPNDNTNIKYFNNHQPYTKKLLTQYDEKDSDRNSVNLPNVQIPKAWTTKTVEIPVQHCACCPNYKNG